MARKTFAAQVKAFETKTKSKLERIVKLAVQACFSDAQNPIGSAAVKPKMARMGHAPFTRGRLPVDTGFLRNTAQSGLNGVVMGEGADAYTLSLAQLQLGDTVYIVWTAEYARHVEYGTSKMPGRFFMRGAALQWQRFVDEAARKVANE